MYVELKNILARVPGPEVAEQILLFQQTLKQKVKQLKSMDNELDLYQQQVGAFKDEIGKLDGEMEKVKKTFFKTQKDKLSMSGVME